MTLDNRSKETPSDARKTWVAPESEHRGSVQELVQQTKVSGNVDAAGTRRVAPPGIGQD